jgi:hypothetical protein
MIKTIRKVIIVLVLMISCQVSENPSSGPLKPHATSTRSAVTNTHACPSTEGTRLVNWLKISGRFFAIK